MDIILFGPPAAGKSTQAKLLNAARDFLHISTGALLRAEVAAGTEFGRAYQAALDRGEFAPDTVVIGMVGRALDSHPSTGNVTFDGFPRTLAQAKALDALLTNRGRVIAAAILFKVDDNELVHRSKERARKASMSRADDAPATFKKRLAIYYQETAPLLAYYAQQKKLCILNGMHPVPEVAWNIARIITRMPRTET